MGAQHYLPGTLHYEADSQWEATILSIWRCLPGLDHAAFAHHGQIAGQFNGVEENVWYLSFPADGALVQVDGKWRTRFVVRHVTRGAVDRQIRAETTIKHSFSVSKKNLFCVHKKISYFCI